MSEKSVSLIIVHFGEINLTKELLRSLDKHRDSKLVDEVVVINNGDSQLTPDETRVIQESIRDTDVIVYHNSEESSYSSGVNLGIENSNNEILIISNNDIKWREDSSIETLISKIIEPGVGAVGPQLVTPSGQQQGQGKEFHKISNQLENILLVNTIKKAISRNSPKTSNGLRKVNGYIVGAFLMTKKSVINSVGRFDENFDFYSEEVDFCKRISTNGYSIYVDYDCKITHIGGATTPDDVEDQFLRTRIDSKINYLKKHHGPFYTEIYLMFYILHKLETTVLLYIIKSASNQDSSDQTKIINQKVKKLNYAWSSDERPLRKIINSRIQRRSDSDP